MNEKNYKYVVIGGQYESICYGCTKTLHQAKLLATKRLELWDNWQGFQKPVIYNFNDTEIVTVQASTIYRDGTEIRVPKFHKQPAFYWSTISKSWVKADCC